MFIAFRLKPGRDDDLIAWVNSLGQDERSYNIRQALRGNTGPVSEPVRVKPKVIPVKSEPPTDNAGDIEKNLDSWF